MSEWQTPTDRAATSTSSGPMLGTGSSATSGRFSPRYWSAFMSVPPIGRSTRTLTWSPVGESSVSKPCSTMSVDRHLRGDDLLDRVAAAGDEVDDARPVGHRVAPGAGERDVVLGQHHRLDRCGPGVQAGLGDPAGGPDGVDRRVCSARSLPEHSMTASTPMPSVAVLEHRRDVDLARVDDLADAEAARRALARTGFTSEIVTLGAERRRRRARRARRSGPAPVMSTVSPGRTCAVSTP